MKQIALGEISGVAQASIANYEREQGFPESKPLLFYFYRRL